MVGDGTEGAGRVADVLLRFIDGPQNFGVSAIARDLGLSKAVVHRILRSLVDRDLLAYDPTTRLYRTGNGAAALGARALRESPLRTTAMPYLRELQEQTGETVTLSARVDLSRVYLEQIVSEQEIKMTVELGQRFPLHRGASGRVILAFLPEQEIDHVVERLTAELSGDDGGAELRRSLQGVRAAGTAVSQAERQAGAASAAAPVFDLDGVPIGSISVCGPQYRLTPEVCAAQAPVVAAVADQVSRELGWAGGLPAAT